MQVADQPRQALVEHMGIDLCRRDVRVAEQLLHRPEIGAVLQEMAGEGMVSAILIRNMMGKQVCPFTFEPETNQYRFRFRLRCRPNDQQPKLKIHICPYRWTRRSRLGYRSVDDYFWKAAETCRRAEILGPCCSDWCKGTLDLEDTSK